MKNKTFAFAALLLLFAGCATRPPEPSFILLGEIHDNAIQHQQRAEVLRQLLADGRLTAIVFEQVPRERDAAVAEQGKRAPQDIEAWVDVAQLDRKGWRWPLHKPLIEAALAAPNTRLLGSNLRRDTLRKMTREGDAAWPPELLARVKATPQSEAQQQAMLRAIDEGHCGVLPAAAQPPMVLAQRARDAAMAEAMLNASKAGAVRVVLIAGNGHVDRELGVPRYLEAAGVPAAQIRAVAYLEPASSDRGRYDERVITPAAEREDPCKGFKR